MPTLKVLCLGPYYWSGRGPCWEDREWAQVLGSNEDILHVPTQGFPFCSKSFYILHLICSSKQYYALGTEPLLFLSHAAKQSEQSSLSHWTNITQPEWVSYLKQSYLSPSKLCVLCQRLSCCFFFLARLSYLWLFLYLLVFNAIIFEPLCTKLISWGSWQKCVFA